MANEVKLKELPDAAITENSRVLFTCPACMDEEGHGHWLLIPFGDAKPLQPGGPVWKHVSGSTVDDLTLSPSINCDLPGSKCSFHGWITDGMVRW